MAAATELDTFVEKFKQLWRSGHGAHLDLDTSDGQAWIGLRLHLGDAPGPPHHPQQVHQQIFKTRNGPARERRRARRSAARLKEAEEATIDHGNVTEEVTDVNVDAEEATAARVAEEAAAARAAEEAAAAARAAEEVADTSVEKGAEETASKTTAEEASNDETVKASSRDFLCAECGKKFASLKNMRIHIGRQHNQTENRSPIPQLDGTSCGDYQTLTYTFVSDYADEDIMYTLREIFPDSFETKLLARLKLGGLNSADYLFTVQLNPPDDEFIWPTMNKIQAEVLKEVKKQ